MIPDPAGGFALDLARGRVRLLAPDADVPVVPCIVGLSVRTSDGNAAIGRLLVERGIPHRATQRCSAVIDACGWRRRALCDAIDGMS